MKHLLILALFVNGLGTGLAVQSLARSTPAGFAAGLAVFLVPLWVLARGK